MEEADARSDLMTPEEFARRSAEALGERLCSVIVFGSAAAGDFVPGVSNLNMLLVTRDLGVTELDRLGPIFSDWCAARNPLPLLFTQDELRMAADAFPIELLDIQQSRKVVWGTDPLAGVQVCRSDLRLQVERELTGKLLALRAQYALTRGQPTGVAQLMVQSHSTFLVLFRAALRLYREEVPELKLEALRELSKHLSLDTTPFERLAEQKQRLADADSRGEALDPETPLRPAVEFADYLQSIEDVVRTINRHVTVKKEETHEH